MQSLVIKLSLKTKSPTSKHFDEKWIWLECSRTGSFCSCSNCKIRFQPYYFSLFWIVDLPPWFLWFFLH